MARQSWLWLTVLCFFLVSCATTIWPREEGVFWEAVAADSVFSLKELSISSRPTTGNLKQTATDIAVLAARKAGFSLDKGEGPAARLNLTISLEEREFGIDIDTFNSVSVVLKIFTDEQTPRQIGQLIYTEDTKKTLRSSPYLTQVMESLFQGLSRRIKAQK